MFFVVFFSPKAMNTISFAMAEEAKSLWMSEIHDNKAIKAVVFISAKPDNFIAGADIQDIKNIEDKSTLVPIIKDGLDLFQTMKSKGVPLVSAINGPALGGGLEVSGRRGGMFNSKRAKHESATLTQPTTLFALALLRT